MKQLAIDDLMHQIKHIARDAAGDGKSSTLGYVAAYDSSTHMVQVVIPSLRETDDNGQPVPIQSDWIPLGTIWAGNGFGLQVAPLAAAATPQDPTKGEQVQVTILDDETGLSAAPAWFFNAKFPPPGGLQPGEAILQHTSGRSIKFGADGKIHVNAGSTPVAVEGSTVTHDHGLFAFCTAIASAITALPSFTQAAVAGVFTTAAGSLLTPASLTDKAGKIGVGTPAANTAAAVDGGQGAQDFLAPSAGGG